MRKSRVFIIAGILVVALFNAGCNVSIEKREPSKNTVSSGINNLATNTKNASNVKTNTNIKEEVNSTINVKESETKNIKKMQIECGISGIKIVPEKRNDIEANLIGTVVNCTWDKSEPLSYKVSGDTLTIDVNNKNGNSNNSFQGNSINLDLTVYVPENLIENIDVLNGVGDLDVSKNTIKNLNIAIGVGKLVGTEFTGNVSGEIGVGDIVLQFEKFEDTSIDMSLGTGNAKVTLPKGSEFDIDATTGVGKIKCDFDVKRAGKEPEVSFIYDELKGSVGNGNSNINLETGVGEISIKSNAFNKETFNTSENIGTVPNADKESIINNEVNSNEKTSVDLNNFNINSKNDSKGIMIGTNNMSDSTKFFFGKFDGTYTIKSIDIKEDEKVTVNYSNELEGGKLNVVILDSDYNILYTLNANEKGSIELDGSLSKNYIIKALGEDAISGRCTFRVE